MSKPKAKTITPTQEVVRLFSGISDVDQRGVLSALRKLNGEADIDPDDGEGDVCEFFITVGTWDDTFEDPGPDSITERLMLNGTERAMLAHGIKELIRPYLDRRAAPIRGAVAS